MLFEIVALLAAACALVIVTNNARKPAIAVPRVGSNPGPFGLRKWFARWDWYKHCHDHMRRRYEQDKDENYVIQTMMGDVLVVAPKYLDDLSMLPESRLSSTMELVDRVMGQFTGVDLLLRDHLSHDACRGPLRKSLPTLVPLMAEELVATMVQQLNQPDPNEPTVATAYRAMYSLVDAVTSRVFVGKESCHEQVWKDALTNLPGDVEITKLILLPFPRFVRPFIAPLIPRRNRIFQQRAEVRDLLFPVPRTTPVSDEPSVLKFFVESQKDTDPDTITARLLILSGAALHTSSMALTHAIFDLCVMPEYVEPLRLEAQASYSEDNGQWRLSTVQRLRRLDSFLKESQRLNNSGFLGFNRVAMDTVTLSDGLVIPRGTKISLPGGPMRYDRQFYEQADRFDGFRFYRPDEGETTIQRDFVGIEPGNLSWGNGRFTCPGRWYASAMLKLIVANLLLSYDISFPEGEIERPANRKYDLHVFPSSVQKIVLRPRN
ncbi:cytochrome P450 [Xylariomycetidae sp. FL2044]|nr:cytochrome P450 [Xylariomycetidae sp. FL2044]